MADVGFWQGAERATGNALATGMKLMEFNANQQNRAEQLMLEKDRLKIAQEEDFRRKQAFDYEQKKRDEQAAIDNAFTPVSLVAPGLSKTPKLRQQYLDSVKTAGFKVNETPDGEIYVQNKAIGHIRNLMETNAAFQKQSLVNIKTDLQGQIVTLSQQLADPKLKPEQAQGIQQQLDALKKNYANVISVDENVMAKILEAQARPGTVDSKPYVDSTGKIVLVNENDPNANNIINSQGLKPYKEQNTSSTIEKRSIGNQMTQDYRVYKDNAGNVTKEEKVGVPYKNAEGVAATRTEGYGDTRIQNVFDTTTGEIRPVSTTDVVADSKKPASERQFLSGSAAERAAKQINLIQDIKMNIDSTRGSVARLKDDFNEKQRFKLYEAIQATDPKSALGNLIHGEFGKSLTKEQVDYLTDVQVLVENAMAMRSVVGMGQGSDELRAAIRATVPGSGTFSKEYANSQLDKFDRTLRNLTRGVPGGSAVTKSLFGNTAPSGGGMVRVKNPSGQIGSIPESQLDAALKQGYTRVQ